jgi:hypothetical protein
VSPVSPVAENYRRQPQTLINKALSPVSPVSPVKKVLPEKKRRKI